MNTPDFNELTPPPELVWEAFGRCMAPVRAPEILYRAGTQHGWQQARQLWPTPITDRPPTEADGDRYGDVQVVSGAGRWKLCHWSYVNGDPWLHTPIWRPSAPKVPMLTVSIDGRPIELTPEQAERVQRLCEALEGGEGGK